MSWYRSRKLYIALFGGLATALSAAVPVLAPVAPYLAAIAVAAIAGHAVTDAAASHGAGSPLSSAPSSAARKIIAAGGREPREEK